MIQSGSRARRGVQGRALNGGRGRHYEEEREEKKKRALDTMSVCVVGHERERREQKNYY